MKKKNKTENKQTETCLDKAKHKARLTQNKKAKHTSYAKTKTQGERRK